MTNLIERIKSVAGQDFDSYGCRVRNPHITARQSIEIADYIVGLEQERDELSAQVERLRGLLRPKVIDLIRCGIGGNYGGSLFDNAMKEYHEPLVLALSETPPVTLAALKAKYQADIITELQNHMINNGYKDEADGVGAWFKER